MKNVGKKLEKNWKKLEKGWKKLEKSWKKIHFFLTRADDLPLKPSRNGPDYNAKNYDNLFHTIDDLSLGFFGRSFIL